MPKHECSDGAARDRGASTKKKILVVEDHPEARQILVFYLRHMGYRTVEAENGKKAVASSKSESPDLIFLDLGLPDISGIEAAALIKQDPDTCHIPIAALTAWSPEVFKERALKAGVAKYLLKPASTVVLRQTIEELTRNAVDFRSADQAI